MKSPIQSYLESLHAELSSLRSGEVASYIPELTKADPDWFGICVVTVDGVAYTAGDTAQRFTIQSVSKPFVYATALADKGRDFVGRRVGVEPSGDAFNSISLHPRTGAPLNPMINAGAIASAGMAAGTTAEQQWERIADSLGVFMGRPITLDEAVYRSESDTGFRNRAIAWMLKNFGIIDGDPMAVLENYFRQCSVLVDCRDLAYMAATLANGGVHPLTGRRALPAPDVERVLSVMATCGMYDYAGSWLYEVGLPAKSGVGGGIIAVLPGRFGIAICSPPLDEKGNSVRGIEVCKRLSRDFGLHLFNKARNPKLAIGRQYTAADAPSRRVPTAAMKARLAQHAHRIKYLSLQGHIEVDAVEYVIRRMGELAPDAHSLILDMSQVEGLSESAARLLNQARANLHTEGIATVLSRVRQRKAILDPLSKTLAAGEHGFLSFEDNDLAVEWCENRLCADAGETAEAAGRLSDCALFRGVPEAPLAQLQATTQRRELTAGSEVFASGDASNGEIHVIVSGHASVLVPRQGGGHQRIASLGPGMSFGEMTLLGQTTRSASVFADTALVCEVVNTADINRLAEEHPQLKIALLENLSGDLAAKLRRATDWVAALA
ncbi:glutaminase A [Niveibacterium umoris]|uniref:Glutaminase n=1 Tax=Niveibacterium umoris TaxID=1193620 RepID=A0A840BMI5_9RHOO|nr:glutaminase [Niveibacterium umoris]